MESANLLIVIILIMSDKFQKYIYSIMVWN